MARVEGRELAQKFLEGAAKAEILAEYFRPELNEKCARRMDFARQQAEYYGFTPDEVYDTEIKGNLDALDLCDTLRERYPHLTQSEF